MDGNAGVVLEGMPESLHQEEDSLQTQVIEKPEISEPMVETVSKPKCLEPGEVFSIRQKSVERAENKLLAAATPLLYFLVQPPEALERVCINKVRATLILEMKSFTQQCQAAKISREHMVTAQYVLCTALDEMIQLRFWRSQNQRQEVSPWSQASLLTIFHKENYGGDKFFLLIGRLAAEPEPHVDVLELMLVLLGSGFEGRYRQDPQGMKIIDAVRERLQNLVDRVRGTYPKELSVHWQGLNQADLPLRKKIPLWLWGTGIGVVLLSQFFYYKYSLLEDTYRLEENIASIGKMDFPRFMEMHHYTHVNLYEFLEKDIENKRLTVEETEGITTIIFKGDSVFKPGGATVERNAAKKIAVIAQKLAGQKSLIAIEGHADSSPLRGGPYEDNQRLSLARAQSVADIFIAHAIETSRISVTGYGDTRPIAENDTSEGRALNRRVAIVIRFE